MPSHRLRERVARVLTALPNVRGKVRATRLLDRWLTDYRDEASYAPVITMQGVKVQLDLREPGDRWFYYFRGYEPEYIAMLRRLYAGGNFLDIGSNVGLYVISMAPAVRAAGGRIFSVEPVPSNVARQRVNVELNGCADLVDCANVVLGAEAGTVRMSGDFASTNVNGVVAVGGTQVFPMTTLDQLAAERGWSGVGAIKMDVEGYEPAVLRGAAGLLARDRPLMLAELNRERMAINGFAMEESWQMLRDLGYRGHELVKGELRPLDEPGEVENLFFLQR